MELSLADQKANCAWITGHSEKGLRGAESRSLAVTALSSGDRPSQRNGVVKRRLKMEDMWGYR